MCGIAGFISVKPKSAGSIGRMTDLIRYRGPDDEGFVLFQGLASQPRICGGQDTPDETYLADVAFAPREHLSALSELPVTVALGHRRLSIVDLSPSGHQPMSSADRRYWIVYNGEIYNYIELRTDLEKLGYRFISHSDTEVIIAAYQEWGKACLSRFNGMFAFLIYNRETDIFFAARDRFGVKPLYYWVSEGRIAFASEIKQFTVLPGWHARMNVQRVYDFLNWGITDHTDETLFAGVFQLRGGQFLEINLREVDKGITPVSANQRLQVNQWYSLEFHAFTGTMQQAAEQFREKLFDSVKLRLRADVPVGSCLSGGLDSSAIVCVVNQMLREQHAYDLQKTFSACAAIAKFDERKWIDIVVKATGVDAHYVYPELPGLFDEAAAITWHQDEPFGSTSIYAQSNVFRLARQHHVKVMLDGQGADEQLAGYHGFFGPHLVMLFRSLRWATLLKEAAAMKRLHGYRYEMAAAYLANYALSEQAKDKLRGLVGGEVMRPNWLNFEQFACVAENPLKIGGAVDAKSIRDLSIAQLTASNLQMLLHWEDRNSMAHSIEARMPFLDYRLVEFVLGLPDEYKLSDGITKRVLRLSMSGIMPDAIRSRMDKLGFVTPEEIWVREMAPELFREKLTEAINASLGLLRKAETLHMLENIISGRQRFSFLPWRLINFGEWVKQYSVTT